MQHPALQSRQPSNRARLLALLWWLGSSGSLHSIDTFTILWPFSLWRKSISQTHAPPELWASLHTKTPFRGMEKGSIVGQNGTDCGWVPSSVGLFSPWLCTEGAAILGTVPCGCSCGHFVPFCHHQQSHFLHRAHALASQGLTKCSKGCKKVLATPCKKKNNNKILFEIHTIQAQNLTLLASQLQLNWCCIFTSKVCLCELWTCCI